MDEVFLRVAALEGRSPHHSPHSSSNTDTNQKHFLKLDVPRFDGADPHGWIFKVTQFFEYHGKSEEERIIVASFYLDDPAMSWYQWMYHNSQIMSW